MALLVHLIQYYYWLHILEIIDTDTRNNGR